MVAPRRAAIFFFKNHGLEEANWFDFAAFFQITIAPPRSRGGSNRPVFYGIYHDSLALLFQLSAMKKV